MVCGARRIRSLYLPWMIVGAPKLSSTTPLEGLASLSTIKVRLCAFAEQTSLPLLTHRGWKPPVCRAGTGRLPQRSSSPTLQLGEAGDHLRDLATASRT
jgi:hypothetical protein